MSRRCEICGKGQTSGNNVSHSNRHTRRKWNPNIQQIKIEENGTSKRIKICTSCIKTMNKPVKTKDSKANTEEAVV